MLKYSLSYAERRAWKKLEKWAAGQQAPPEHEDMDESLVEDLEAGPDELEEDESEEVDRGEL